MTALYRYTVGTCRKCGVAVVRGKDANGAAVDYKNDVGSRHLPYLEPDEVIDTTLLLHRHECNGGTK